MYAVTSEDDLSCSICECLFTDPRFLPCGHTFCAVCIAQWRQSSRQCPICRGPIGAVDLPKNVTLLRLVDSFREQARSGSVCQKCGLAGEQRRVCQHCRHSLCPGCTVKHVDKLRVRLRQRATQLIEVVERLEAGIEPLCATQASWTSIQAGLSSALDTVNSRLDRLNLAVQSQTESVHAARELLHADLDPTALASKDAAAAGRGIEAANRLCDRLTEVATTGIGNLAADAASVDEAEQLVSRLAACLAGDGAAAATVPSAAASPQQPPSQASLAEYYARFPQRCTNYFSVVGSVVALSACWNTAGFLHGRGIIASAAEVGAAAADFRPLPAEVLILLEGVPPHTKVKMYDQSGAYKGNVNMRLPDGSQMTGPPSYSLAVNSTKQLLAVSLPKSNAVLVTSLDGAGKQLITRCGGVDLDNPLGVCISDAGRVFIADYRNRRVCCVCSNSGQTVRVFEHSSLARVDRLALCKSGEVLARVEPCNLVLLIDSPAGGDASGGGFTARQIERKFFHFFVDQFGGLVFTSGGAAESGQLRMMAQPTAASGEQLGERQLLHWPEVKYSCLTALRSGRVVAAAANRKEIHLF